jgi:hypothetical protein
MCRRIRVADRLHVLDLRDALCRFGALRGAGLVTPQGRHPRRRSEPHRPRDRVRLLLLPCRFRAAGGRFRSDHDQLQPGDRLDGLRHVRPALFRTADGRRRARDPARRTGGRATGGGHRAVRRPDPAEASGRAGEGRHLHSRHIARRHRPRRGPRPVPEALAPAQPGAAEERHCLFGGAGAHRGGGAGVSAGGAALLRAWRPGHADHPRRNDAADIPAGHRARPGAGRHQAEISQRQDRPDQYAARQESAAFRHLSHRGDRGGRRLPVRWQRGLRGGHSGAYRGGWNARPPRWRAPSRWAAS